jgi:hypothetical protein
MGGDISSRPWLRQSPPEQVPSMVSRVGGNLADARLTESHQKGESRTCAG